MLAKRKPEPGQFAVYYFGTGEWGWVSHSNSVSWENGDEAHRLGRGARSFRLPVRDTALLFPPAD